MLICVASWWLVSVVWTFRGWRGDSGMNKIEERRGQKSRCTSVSVINSALSSLPDSLFVQYNILIILAIKKWQNISHYFLAHLINRAPC